MSIRKVRIGEDNPPDGSDSTPPLMFDLFSFPFPLFHAESFSATSLVIKKFLPATRDYADFYSVRPTPRTISPPSFAAALPLLTPSNPPPNHLRLDHVHADDSRFELRQSRK